jgi:hypothetical protein
MFTIKDEAGNIVKEQYKSASKGIQREKWSLTYSGKSPIGGDEFDATANKNAWGFPIMPGKYSVTLYMVFDGKKDLMAGPVEFEAKALNNTTLPAENREVLVAFQNQVAELMRIMNGAEEYMDAMEKRIVAVRQTIHNTPGIPFELGDVTKSLAEKLDDLYFLLDGTSTGASWEEVPPEKMPLNIRMQYVAWGMWGSTSEPTQTMKDNYAILIEEFPQVITALKSMNSELNTIEKELDNYGAPWTPGRIPEFKK